jgi:hypothetical protein
VMLPADAFRRGWSGRPLLVAGPGETAVLPAPVASPRKRP